MDAADREILRECGIAVPPETPASTKLLRDLGAVHVEFEPCRFQHILEMATELRDEPSEFGDESPVVFVSATATSPRVALRIEDLLEKRVEKRYEKRELLVPVLVCVDKMRTFTTFVAGGRRSEETTPPVFVPATARSFWSALVASIHQSLAHAGTARVLAAVENTGWHVPSMRTVVDDVLRRCEPCARLKGGASGWRPTASVRSTSGIMAPSLFAAVHADFFLVDVPSTEGHIGVLTFTDAFSRRRALVPVKDQTVETFASAFLHRWVVTYGWPLRLSTDNGPAFTSNVLAAAMREWGVQHSFTTAYHPQANGVDERLHRTLRQWTAAVLRDGEWAGGEWNRALPVVELVLNTTVHKATGYSPHYLCFGVPPSLPPSFRTPLASKLVSERLLDAEWLPGPAESDEAAMDEAERRRKKCLRRTADVLADMRLSAWDRVLRLADKADWMASEQGARAKRPQRAYAEGEYVMVFEPEVLAKDTAEDLPLKFQAHRWSGPWRVLAVVRGVSLMLTRADDPLVARSATVLRCKPAVLAVDVVESYERLFRTLEEGDKRTRERIAHSRRRVAGWGPEESARDVVEYAFRRILREETTTKRGAAAVRYLVIEWSDGDITREKYDTFASDAPDAVRAWEERKRAVPPDGGLRDVPHPAGHLKSVLRRAKRRSGKG
jgi:transposase InsO family protein